MVEKLPYLSIEHHLALAKVALRVGQLEWHLEALLHVMLLDTPKLAGVLLDSQGERIVVLCQNALLDGYPDQVDYINELFVEIRAVRSQRHEYVHWIWGQGPDETRATYTKGRFWSEKEPKQPHNPNAKKQHETTKFATADEIDSFSHRALECTKAIMYWSDRHFEDLKVATAREKKHIDRDQEDRMAAEWAAQGGFFGSQIKGE
jgi:hypothetical protein